jgi:beta-glucanase (GH16 family)
MTIRPLQRKLGLLPALILALAGSSSSGVAGDAGGPPPPPAGKHWRLVWADEFNGDALDLTKWSLPGNNRPRSSGMMSNDHIKVGGGVAQFKVDRINGKVTSAIISSENKMEITQGYYEIRAKLPRTPGYRPAFWLSAKTINNINDPAHPTEVDVMEYPGRNGAVQVNLHWNGYGPSHQTVGSVSGVPTPPNEFHTFGVWWYHDGYHFYVDRIPVWFSAGGGASAAPEFIRLGNEMFNNEQLVNGRQVDQFPPDDTFTVDYVRVYQLQ